MRLVPALATLVFVAAILFATASSPLPSYGPGTRDADDTTMQGASAPCELTEPLHGKPSDQSGAGPMHEGLWYVNEDRSIWLRAREWYAGAGYKLIWIRPQGEQLKVTGRRLDGPAPPLRIETPCCYTAGFQVTGLEFPSDGCWEVTAAAGRSELVFVVQVNVATSAKPTDTDR